MGAVRTVLERRSAGVLADPAGTAITVAAAPASPAAPGGGVKARSAAGGATVTRSTGVVELPSGQCSKATIALVTASSRIEEATRIPVVQKLVM
jgi:hypothetical protein